MEASDSTALRIIELRAQYPNMLQSDIARKVGCSRSYVSLLLSPRPAKPRPKSRINPMLKTGEAALYLNVHPNTLRRWDDRITHYRIGGRGDRRYRKDDLDIVLRTCKGEGAP